METKKILIIGGLILFLFLIIRRKPSNTNTATNTNTNTTVVYRRPVTPAVGPNPHYNAYKAQYYN